MKSPCPQRRAFIIPSPPARGAWIEIKIRRIYKAPVKAVAPRTGGVD